MLLVILLAACGLFDSPEELRKGPPPVTDAPVAVDDAALARARDAATELQTRFRERLFAVLGAEGPRAAVEVCAGEAPTIAAALAEERGVQLGRSSLRLRNPANQGPMWVAAWLARQGERPAEGVEGVEEVVETPEGRIARVLQPIAVAPPCLTCHGPVEQIPPEVREVLAERYPQDAATGYAAGDLRGAVWVEAPVAL